MTPPTPALTRNLALFPAFSFVSDFLVIAPVLVPWYTAHGLGATAVFTIQAIFAVAVVVFEVPGGFLADALGRANALRAGALLWPLGLLLYLFGEGFWQFAAAEVLLALGVSLFSGCVSALLFDSLLGLGRQEEYSDREGNLAAAARIGTLFASLLGGFLALRSLELVFLVNLGAMLLLLPISLLMREPDRERPPLREARREILVVAGRCLRDPKLRAIVGGGAVLRTVGCVVIWASMLATGSWDLPLWVNGLVFALLQAFGAWGGRTSTPLRHRLGTRAFLILLASMGPLLVLGSLGWSWPVVVVFCLVVLLWNVGNPFFLTALNQRTESRTRATTLSFASLAGSVMFVVLSPLFGLAVDRWSLDRALALLGLLTALALAWVARSLWRMPPVEG